MVFFICPLKIGLPGALPAIEFVAVAPCVKPTGQKRSLYKHDFQKRQI